MEYIGTNSPSPLLSPLSPASLASPSPSLSLSLSCHPLSLSPPSLLSLTALPLSPLSHFSPLSPHSPLFCPSLARSHPPSGKVRNGERGKARTSGESPGREGVEGLRRESW